MRNFDTMEISLALPSVKAKALANFVKRVDFETVARMASVSVVADGKSEADLIWLALIGVRNALAQAGTGTAHAPPARGGRLTVVPGTEASPRCSAGRR